MREKLGGAHIENPRNWLPLGNARKLPNDRKNGIRYFKNFWINID